MQWSLTFSLHTYPYLLVFSYFYLLSIHALAAKIIKKYEDYKFSTE